MENSSVNEFKSLLFPSAQSSIVGNKKDHEKERNEEGDATYNWLSLKSYKGDAVQCGELSSESESDSDTSGSRNSQDSRRRISVEKKSNKRKKKKKSKEVINRKPKTIWLEESIHVTDEPFRIDRSKDNANLQYNTLYRLDVANSNIKYWRCLGVTKKTNIADKYYAKKKLKLKKRKPSSTVRYHDLKKYNDIPVPLSHSTAGKDDEANVLQEFVPLHLVAEIEDNNEEHLQSNKDTVTIAIEEFNMYLHDNPLDIKKWLEFCEFQGKLVQGDLNVSATLTNKSNQPGSHSKIVVEKQISILERALEKNPTSMDLIMKYMSICRELTEYGEYNKKWKNTIFKQPNNITLWLQLLLTSYSSFAHFNITSCLADYKKCFSMLIAIQEGVMKSHQPTDDFVDGMMAIFLQQAIFLSQAGYTEKSIALFQSLIEFNCFCPDELQHVSLELRKNVFQFYFESEFPRIGDCSCSGWSVWDSNYKHGSQSSLDCDHKVSKNISTNIEDVDKTSCQKIAWLKLERLRSEHQFLPYRLTSSNKEDCDDADRMILFNDVSYCLFKITSPEHKHQLLLIFLAYLGVPISLDLFSDHVKDVFSKTEEHLSYPTSSGVLNFQLFKGIKTTNSRFLNISSQENNVNILPESALTFIREIFNQSLQYFKESHVISNIFLQFELIHYVNTVSVLSKSDKKIAKKSLQDKCKTILGHQDNRNCLPLWTTYATIEYQLGNVSNAKRVLMMALSSGNNKQNPGSQPLPYVSAHRLLMELELNLFSSHAQYEWSDGTINNMITLLASLSSQRSLPMKFNDEEPSSLLLLKCKSDFENGTNELKKLSKSEDNNINHIQLCEWLCCHAMFELFNSNIQTALSFLDNSLAAIKDINITTLSDAAIALITYKIQLMKFALSQGLISHKEFQAMVRDGLCRYPHSLWLIELFTMATDNFLNSLDVRRQFESIALKSSSPWFWWLAISYEKLKQDKFIAVQSLSDHVNGESKNVIAMTTIPTNGINHRIRSLLMRATESDKSAYCVSLWRRYIDFEVSLGNIEKAKHVYYKALQNCPWSKTVNMVYSVNFDKGIFHGFFSLFDKPRQYTLEVLFQDAIEKLENQYETTVDLMLEKELRVRLPVEEFEMLLNE